ncbi:cytochrome P450 family protein [Ketogulonicigenium robustum]|uniref:Cytochrome P450 family protein n=2 Tax=Ketogulonicigenium robustum TaxID=92947 RepID=A0A1W6NZL9_9RHOB|nr:cytochrome P450 family protein [Ketogulonicigenium robustum]
MAEMRTPFFHSFMVNDPALTKVVLKERPDDFPKSDRIAAGLIPLLGRDSVFLTNGAQWKQQRRIIDPAFEGGRLREIFPVIWESAAAAVARLGATPAGSVVEIDHHASHAAADVIFRTLFSIPIESDVAREVFEAFRDHQRSRPVMNLGAFINLPAWVPRFPSRKTGETARRIRRLISKMVDERQAQIAAGTAPDDLATKIMTTADPETGALFTPAEMVDQVAIFFLAGHETSASALAWALYLVALYPEWQDQAAREAQGMAAEFSALSKLRINRDIFRETLRLYPPVPMMVREATAPETFRDRAVPVGAQIVLSPWHLHRHTRFWQSPDDFDPARWSTPECRASARDAYMPFSEGPRVCVGAGFAMLEGTLILAMLLRDFRFEVVEGRDPVPVAYMTVRAKDGIWLRVTPRGPVNPPAQTTG